MLSLRLGLQQRTHPLCSTVLSLLLHPHTHPRAGRGGGTGFLISFKWCPQPGLQEPRCDTGQPAVLCWQLLCDNQLLHSNSAHQEDTSVPHPASAGSGPDSCHLVPGLLQFPSGWCACMRHLAAQTECSKPAGRQHIQVPLRHWYLPTMLSGPGPSNIQDMIELYTAAHPLQSATANWLPAPALRGGPSYHSTKSYFAVLAPQ